MVVIILVIVMDQSQARGEPCTLACHPSSETGYLCELVVICPEIREISPRPREYQVVVDVVFLVWLLKTGEKLDYIGILHMVKPPQRLNLMKERPMLREHQVFEGKDVIWVLNNLH